MRGQIISARQANNTAFSVPRLITLGGDHTTYAKSGGRSHSGVSGTWPAILVIETLLII